MYLYFHRDHYLCRISETWALCYLSTYENKNTRIFFKVRQFCFPRNWIRTQIIKWPTIVCGGKRHLYCRIWCYFIHSFCRSWLLFQYTNEYLCSLAKNSESCVKRLQNGTLHPFLLTTLGWLQFILMEEEKVGVVLTKKNLFLI